MSEPTSAESEGAVGGLPLLDPTYEVDAPRRYNFNKEEWEKSAGDSWFDQHPDYDPVEFDGEGAEEIPTVEPTTTETEQTEAVTVTSAEATGMTMTMIAEPVIASGGYETPVNSLETAAYLTPATSIQPKGPAIASGNDGAPVEIPASLFGNTSIRNSSTGSVPSGAIPKTNAGANPAAASGVIPKTKNAHVPKIVPKKSSEPAATTMKKSAVTGPRPTGLKAPTPRRERSSEVPPKPAVPKASDVTAKAPAVKARPLGLTLEQRMAAHLEAAKRKRMEPYGATLKETNAAIVLNNSNTSSTGGPRRIDRRSIDRLSQPKYPVKNVKPKEEAALKPVPVIRGRPPLRVATVVQPFNLRSTIRTRSTSREAAKSVKVEAKPSVQRRSGSAGRPVPASTTSQDLRGIQRREPSPHRRSVALVAGPPNFATDKRLNERKNKAAVAAGAENADPNPHAAPPKPTQRRSIFTTKRLSGTQSTPLGPKDANLPGSSNE